MSQRYNKYTLNSSLNLAVYCMKCNMGNCAADKVSTVSIRTLMFPSGRFSTKLGKWTIIYQRFVRQMLKYKEHQYRKQLQVTSFPVWWVICIALEIASYWLKRLFNYGKLPNGYTGWWETSVNNLIEDAILMTIKQSTNFKHFSRTPMLHLITIILIWTLACEKNDIRIREIHFG